MRELFLRQLLSRWIKVFLRMAEENHDFLGFFRISPFTFLQRVLPIYLVIIAILGILSTATTAQNAGSQRAFEKVYFIDPLVGYLVELQNVSARFVTSDHREVPSSRIHQQVYETRDGGNTWKVLPISRSLGDNTAVRAFTINKFGRIAFASYKQSEPEFHTLRASVPQELDRPGRKFLDEIKRIHFIDDQNGWITGPGRLWRSTNGGESWEKIKLPLHGNAAGSISLDQGSFFFVDNTVAYVSMPDGTVFKSTNGGKTWEQTGRVGGIISTIFFTDRDHGWAGGYEGRVYSSVDGGRTWQRQNAGLEIDPRMGRSEIRKLFFKDARNGWILAMLEEGKSCVVSTNDGGATWVKQITFTDTNLSLIDLHFTDQNNGWVVGNNSTLLQTNDGGRTWRRVVFNLVN